MKVLFVGGTGVISSACSELALARGKKLHDKREADAKRTAEAEALLPDARVFVQRVRRVEEQANQRRAALRGASFRSVRELRLAIDAFIKAYNQTAAPFEWTKVKVYPKSLTSKYASLCK